MSAACGAAVGRICATAMTARPEATANGTIGRFISFPPWFTPTAIGILAFRSCNHLLCPSFTVTL